MATLVLTTVGGAIGGPIGAALGGVIGQAIDRNVLFAPAARQGARLTDLRVQTSSYGTPIARVFGTMRVAGCVIWATELRETRSSSRGGKGQPGVTAYSYSASFAVALSARPIERVGRIWAEGKLLRGAGGDWKTPTGFRLHRGDEAQRPDPLIASLEPHAPAYRGIAYAVFENLHLADFGNRIPSLTFEVIADAATPTTGTVARELGGGAVTVGDAATPLHGYAAGGDSVATVLGTLATIGGGWLVPDGATMRLGEAAGVPVTIDADAAVQEARRPIETVPRRLSLSCYDPDRDYQIGVQQARRPGDAGWRDDAIDVPAALPATQARGVVQAALRRAEQERVTRRVTLDAAALALTPGMTVRLRDQASLWRVTRTALERHRVTLDLVRVTSGALDLPADAGQALVAPDVRAAATRLVAAELPALDDVRHDATRIAVLAAGDNPSWRGAALMTSGDGGARWDAAATTAAPAVLGQLTRPVAPGSDRLVDRGGTIEVLLAHDDMTLASIGAAAFDRGGNVALLGGELVQFRTAVQVAPRRWRLSTVLRGRRGTPAIAHAAGTPFALVTMDSVAAVPLPTARAGDTVRLLAQGVGDAQPVTVDVTLTGASVAPPAPVRLRVLRARDGGATLHWVRRSRIGWRWDDGADAPLGEERERYAITVVQAGASRTVMVDTPEWRLPADIVAGADTHIAVRQHGTFGVSAPAELILQGGR